MARIVIGARSAIFAPLENIGIIVVDEEHETSFKQSDGLRYNARDLALVRGRMERAVVLLGSATPLITSLYAAEQGRLELLRLPERVRGNPLPVVRVIDMRGIKESISPGLLHALEETLAARGTGHHLSEPARVCHLSGLRGVRPAAHLPQLFGNAHLSSRTRPERLSLLRLHPARSRSLPGLRLSGAERAGGGEPSGSSMIWEKRFPTARILRMDSDTTAGKGSHGRLLKRMDDGAADILIGTQMITKGHDFPGVTLVGVINGESSLHQPDFRSSERTFQLLCQVFGRAGRGDSPGKVAVAGVSIRSLRNSVRHRPR